MLFSCKCTLFFKKQGRRIWLVIQTSSGLPKQDRLGECVGVSAGRGIAAFTYVSKDRAAQPWDSSPGVPPQGHGPGRQLRRTWKAEHQAKEDHSGALSFNVVWFIKFGLTRDPFILFPFLCLSFGMVLPVLCLSHQCIMEAQNLFGFTCSQLPQDEYCLESHS